MKKWLPILLLLASPLKAQTLNHVLVSCSQGGNLLAVPSIISPGGVNTPTNIQGSYPGATATVYITGSNPYTKATLYSSSSGSPLSNPASCDSTGLLSFWVNNPQVDITFSGTGITTPFSFLSYEVFPLNSAVKPETSDAIQYVSADSNASDSNDGLSLGSAVADVPTAYDNLPPCTYSGYTVSGFATSYTFSHCGQIFVAAGTYTLPSQFTMLPMVSIIGQNPADTVISFTGSTGCAIYWTSSPFIPEFAGSGWLENLRIDGANASAGTCGLETYAITNLHIVNVNITNFSGSGSIGWNDNTGSDWNEKYNVEMTLMNNTTDVVFNDNSNGETLGYGVFNLKIVVNAGQTGFSTLGTSSIENSMFNMMLNIPSTSGVGISVGGTTTLANNLYNIHIEAPSGSYAGNEITVASGATFSGVGEINQDKAATNSISGVFIPNASTINVNGSSSFNSFGQQSAINLLNPVSSPYSSYGGFFSQQYAGSTNTNQLQIALFGEGIQSGAGTNNVMAALGAQVAAENGAAEVNNAYGLDVLGPSIVGTGTIGNAFGVYINGQSESGVSTGYGLYQAGSSDANVFNGPVEISNQKSDGSVPTCYDSSNYLSTCSGITYQNQISGNVTLGTSSYTASSGSFPAVTTTTAGTWLVNASVNLQTTSVTASTNFTCQLYDGNTVLAQSYWDTGTLATATVQGNQISMTAVATESAAVTFTARCTSTTASQLMLAAAPNNSGGNLSSTIDAVRIQ